MQDEDVASIGARAYERAANAVRAATQSVDMLGAKR